MKPRLHIRNPDALAFVLFAYVDLLFAAGLFCLGTISLPIAGGMVLGAVIFLVAGYRMGRD